MIQEKWSQIEWYLNNGFSLVPVRNKEESFNGRLYPAKTPIGQWKRFQTEIIHKDVLWEQIDTRPDTSVAVVCGAVSGGLEIIDLDEKHNPGGSVRYLKEIQDFYPEIYTKLRIHKTPSAGFHILYRCEELLTDGNRKLAVAEGQKEAWIETRGEGGYALIPPAKGYAIVQNAPIPVLSLSERNSLISLALCHDTRRKVEDAPRYKKDDNYYSENPFVHFNNSPDSPSVLLNYGWQLEKETGGYLHFTRPGKDSGVSASYIKDKNVFYIFTSSTEFDNNKGYLPSTALAILAFGGDKKKTYRYLVEQGYGIVRPDVERRVLKAAATKGASLPKNFSDEAKDSFIKERERLSETYPYGVFWNGDAVAGYKINRERLYHIASSLGFRLYDHQEICQISGHVVKKVPPRFFFDSIKGYIKEEDSDTQEAICNAFEAFLQNAGKFTISRLPEIDMGAFIHSTKTTSFKFFKNCYLSIKSSGYKIHQYSDLKSNKSLIWHDQIQQRDFSPMPESEFAQGLYGEFLRLSILNIDAIKPVLGYLAHDYKDESMGYIIVLTEAVSNPKDGGGSGKNIFCSLLSGTTTQKDVAGSQIQLNEKFLQSWNGERVFCISDVGKRFNFLFLKNISTNTGILKKLFKDEVSISASEMPKIIVSTNYSFEITDGGLKRRIIPIEFTNFFTLCGGVDAHFDKMFPADWKDEDWLAYDNFIVHCISEYLKSPKLKPATLSDSGWEKQFETNFGHNTKLFFDENMASWVKSGHITNKDFTNAYTSFCSEYGVPKNYQLSMRRLNEALTEYCKKNNIPYEYNVSLRGTYEVSKGKVFGGTVKDMKAPF